MNRAEKKTEIAELRRRIESSEILVLTHNKGLTVKQQTALRDDLRKLGAGFGYKVAKNTLVRLALQGTRYEGTIEMFKGPVGIVTGKDPVAAAKAAVDFAKANDKLVIVGASMGDANLTAKHVEQLAKLPSLDELRGTIVGLLVAPATRIATCVQAPAAQLARVTRAYADKG